MSEDVSKPQFLVKLEEVCRCHFISAAQPLCSWRVDSWQLFRGRSVEAAYQLLQFHIVEIRHLQIVPHIHEIIQIT